MADAEMNIGLCMLSQPMPHGTEIRAAAEDSLILSELVQDTNLFRARLSSRRL